MLELIGWTATALFASSYFFKRAAHLRLTQAIAATLWISYGIALGAAPIIVANLLVAVMAAYSTWRQHTETVKLAAAAARNR